jgi:pyruvyl transferase EpsO
MRELDTALNAIAMSLPRGSHIVYLDIPVYFNVGDLLINQGTEVFFRRMGYSVHARLTLEDLCEPSGPQTESLKLRPRAIKYLESLDPKVAIVFQGGGNFGDLYPRHQLMREAIAKRFSRRLLVMLPQSAHFSSREKAAASLDRFACHSNLHLYFRDHESVELARSRGLSKVFLLPDMAHALRPSMKAKADNFGIGKDSICFRRSDEEGTTWKYPGSVRTEGDWNLLIHKTHGAGNRIVTEMMRRRLDPTMKTPIALWYLITKSIVADAIQLFLSHESVVTDRLHAVILAALLDRPVKYVDNSYGKLSRYSNVFLSQSPLVRPLELPVEG